MPKARRVQWESGKAGKAGKAEKGIEKCGCRMPTMKNATAAANSNSAAD